MLPQIVALSAAALLATGASAPSPQDGSHNPAVKDGAPHKIAEPAEGANSFTEDQARGRFTKAGYTQVDKLTKKNGLWHGIARKNGKEIAIMLDYKGNVTVR